MSELRLTWDNSTDGISVIYSGELGKTPLSIVGDPNRTNKVRTLRIALYNDQQTVEVSISQQARSRSYSVNYNDSYQ